MKKYNLLKVSKELLPIGYITILSVMLLAACSNNSSGSSPANTTTLAQYKAMLAYMPVNTSKSSLREAGDTKQQSFTIANNVNLIDLRVTLFSTNNCQFGTNTATVTMSGGNAGVSFDAGTYTSTNASNLALQSRFGNLVTTLNAQSVRFDYNYNTANGGPGWVSADCMENTGLANYESSPAECINGSQCGFDQAIQQDALLPESFQRAIFTTNTLTNGNMGGFAGADAICNNDLNKPKLGAASLYKALLAGNNSTTAGVNYYRSDYTTKIATATGNNLVAFGNASALLNSVSSGLAHNVWTGFTPAMTADGNGWFYYANDATHNNCLAWQGGNNTSYGIAGANNIAESQAQVTTPYYNTGWAVSSNTTCNTSLPIMCVQQSLESAPNIPGTLAISVSTSFIHIGESINAEVSLANSSGITTPLAISITSDEPEVMSVTPASCFLTTAAASCTVKLTGTTSGTATFSVSANNYQSTTSDTMLIRYPMALITNYYGTNSPYTQCNIGMDGIESTSCFNVVLQPPGDLTGPSQLAIYQGFIYIVNYDNNSYTQCQMNAYGIESSTCNTVTPNVEGVEILSYPTGIAVLGQYVYISNQVSSSYTQCNITASGIESSTCNIITPTGSGALFGPAGMAISGNNIYFANFNTGGVSTYTYCIAGESGIDPNTCSTITPPDSTLHRVQGVTISNGFAYFADWEEYPDGSYTQCSITADVIDAGSCVRITPTGIGVLVYPVSVTIYKNKAYFLEDGGAGGSSDYTTCDVGIAGIESSTCVTKSMDNLLNAPQYMVIY